MASLKPLGALSHFFPPRIRGVGKMGNPTVPTAGEMGKMGNHRFTRTGEMPYTRKDGTQTTLARWQGLCRLCGKPFEVTTPLPGADGFIRTKAFGRVMCDEHKQQRRQLVRGEGGVIASPQIEEKPTDGRPYREGGLFHRWWLVTFINCEVLRRYQEPVALDRVLSEHHAALAAVPVEG